MFAGRGARAASEAQNARPLAATPPAARHASRPPSPRRPAPRSACGLPSTLSNFQGNHACAREVKVGRPASLAEAQALVRAYAKVKASGVGHSWNEDLFCAGDDAAAINLVMTELKPTLDFILRPPAPTLAPPPGFPIAVDEERRTVTVAAGVPQRMLLDYLAEYRMGKQPDGWSLPAYSWFVDQVIN
jgi:FAD/FMN-containing dehydrogenase